MYRNNISARFIITKEDYPDVLNDLICFNSMDDNTRSLIKAKWNKLAEEDIPPVALKRRGTPLEDNWQDTLKRHIEETEQFLNEHPSMRCQPVVSELKSIIDNKDIKIINDFRKGREPINNVNIIRNNDYLVAIYNRLINSTQTDVVFIGVPINAIQEIESFKFLKNYLPKKNHDFSVKTKITKINDDLFGLVKISIHTLVLSQYE